MTRQRLDALKAMARQDVSPNERDIARDKLLAMGEGWDEPPHRPPAAPTPFEPRWSSSSNAATQFTTNYVHIRVTFRGPLG